MPMDEPRYRAHEARLWKDEGGLSPKEHRIALAHAGCSVRVQEVGEGPPVVFLHGGPNAGSTWAPLVRRLGGFRCLLVDRPGTGLSDALASIPRPKELRELGDHIVADVLDGLEIPRAHVVASSFGGFLALRSAAKHPDRVQRMVQMACPAFAPQMKIPPFMRLLSLGVVRWILARLEPNVKVGKDIMRQIGHGASIDADRIPLHFFEWYVALQKYTDTMHNDGEMIASASSFFGGFSPELTLDDALLGSVPAPTFFYWGEDDSFGGKEVAEAIVRAMPSAELEMVPRAGHLPWLDDPEACARLTSAFLERARGPTAGASA